MEGNGDVRSLDLRNLSLLFASGRLETGSDLEGVIDPPLETSEGTNHENSSSETNPESLETNLLIDLRSRFFRGVVDL